jgi:hypothetical protein
VKRFSLRNHCPSWADVKACVVIAVSLSYFCVAANNSDTGVCRRLAILSSVEIEESGLSDLLTVQLQQLPGVELVERDLLQEVFKEITLSMMLGAEQSENRRKAGTLLKADMLVLLSLEKLVGQQNVRFVISDCSHGVRLRIGWLAFDRDKLADTCNDLAKALSDTLEHFRTGVKQIIGVSYFASQDLVHDYDHLQAGYVNLLGNALSSLPGTAVIEIEEARSVRFEDALAGDMQTYRVVPLFVEGEYRVRNPRSKAQNRVHITVRISDSNGVIRQIDSNDLNMDKVAEFITDDVVREVRRLSKSASLETLDKEKQFQMLVERASEFARVGSWNQSISLREAAVLSKPDSVDQRIILIHEYCRIGKRTSALEHFEYMICNRMISIGKATGLSKELLLGSGRVFRRRFVRTAYLEILKLRPSKPGRELRECQQWYEFLAAFLFSSEWDHRLLGCIAPHKDDLVLWLQLHESVVPEGVGPSQYFLSFLKDHAEPGWRKRSPFLHGRLYFAKHPEHFTQQDFLDFIAALIRFERPLCSFCGRYALFYREYYLRQKHRAAMDDLCGELESFLNVVDEHENFYRLGKATRKLLKEIEEYIRENKDEP